MAGDLYAGLDIGGTKLLCALVTGAGRVAARAKERVPRGAGGAAVLALANALLERARAECGGARLRGMGAAIPGIVDPRRQRIVAAPNLRLDGYPLAARLRARWRVPVALGNDVNLALLGEQWRGAARGKRSVVGLFAGTGVGGAALVDGRLLQGAHGAAGEFGHIQVRRGGRPCGCGKRGCLEAYASRGAIERRLWAWLREGRPSALRGMLEPGERRIRSRLLAEALARGDRLVARALERAGSRLGDACVSLRQIFDPELIVLGGGLIEACGGFLLPIVRRAVAADPFFGKLGRCPVVAARLGDDAAAVGAARLALEARP